MKNNIVLFALSALALPAFVATASAHPDHCFHGRVVHCGHHVVGCGYHGHYRVGCRTGWGCTVSAPVVNEEVVDQQVVTNEVVDQPVVTEDVVEQPVCTKIVKRPVVTEEIVEQPVIKKIIKRPIVIKKVVTEPVVTYSAPVVYENVDYCSPTYRGWCTSGRFYRGCAHGHTYCGHGHVYRSCYHGSKHICR